MNSANVCYQSIFPIQSRTNIPKKLKKKAKAEKTLKEIFLELETKAITNSSGSGVALIKPARAGNIYLRIKSGVCFFILEFIHLKNLLWAKYSISFSRDIFNALKTIKLPTTEPIVAAMPASQKFWMLGEIKRIAAAGPVVKP